jgi:hypothetical protein
LNAAPKNSGTASALRFARSVGSNRQSEDDPEKHARGLDPRVAEFSDSSFDKPACQTVNVIQLTELQSDRRGIDRFFEFIEQFRNLATQQQFR